MGSIHRDLVAAAAIALSFSAAGCASVGRTVGAGLAGTGLAMTGTGVVLAAGCTSPSPQNPAIEERGPCMPADTYETYKPAIITGITLGLILIGAGVAVYSVSSPPAEDPAPPRAKPPKEPEKEPEERPSDGACKAYCF